MKTYFLYSRNRLASDSLHMRQGGAKRRSGVPLQRVVNDGANDIEHDDGCEALPLQQDEEQGRGQDKAVAQTVALPAEVLELQGEHRDFGYQHPAR